MKNENIVVFIPLWISPLFLVVGQYFADYTKNNLLIYGSFVAALFCLGCFYIASFKKRISTKEYVVVGVMPWFLFWISLVCIYQAIF